MRFLLKTMETLNETVEVAIDAAFEAGYRHVDTAYAYNNEVEIGRALKKWFDSGKLKREDIFVTTKLPIMAMNEDRVELFLNKSLTNFGLDYVDLYLIHFPVGTKYVGDVFDFNQEVEVEEVDHVAIWKKMEEQVDAGRAKNIGLANFNETQISRILKSARIKPACLQVEVHVMFRQKSLVEYAQKNDIVVIGYAPLANPGFNDFLNTIGVEPRELPDLIGNEVVKKIAKKHNKNPSQVVLRFLLQRNIVVIPKSKTPSRIANNIEIFDFTLDACDMQKLYALEKGEDARVWDSRVFQGLRDAPEWPWANSV